MTGVRLHYAECLEHANDHGGGTEQEQDEMENAKEKQTRKEDAVRRQPQRHMTAEEEC